MFVAWQLASCDFNSAHHSCGYIYIRIFILGSFSNFQVLQTLILPSLIGLTSLIVLKIKTGNNTKQLQMKQESNTNDPNQRQQQCDKTVRRWCNLQQQRSREQLIEL